MNGRYRQIWKRTGITFLLFFTVQFSFGQKITNLVLEGGGIKGLAYPGAMIELGKRGLLDSVTRVAGTSSGGLNALLFAVGYTPEEMKQVVLDFKVHRIDQRGFPIIGPWIRITNKFGWYSSERLLGYIEEMVNHKTKNRNLTFRQLHDSALVKPFKYRDLYLTGTDLVTQSNVVFSHGTFPNMRIADAARISMAIPLYFEAIFLDSNGTVLESKKAMNMNTMILVDGGLGLNYPIHIFDTLVTGNPHSVFIPNPQTLGLRFDSDEQIDYNIRGKGLAPVRIQKVTEFIGAFFNVSFEEINRSALSQRDWDRTVFIDTEHFSPRIRKLSIEEKLYLMDLGAKGVVNFVNGN